MVAVAVEFVVAVVGGGSSGGVRVGRGSDSLSCSLRGGSRLRGSGSLSCSLRGVWSRWLTAVMVLLLVVELVLVVVVVAATCSLR